RPSKVTEPEVRRPFSARVPVTARPMVDFPGPDSPTRASTLPAGRRSETSSRARTAPRPGAWKSTARRSIRSRGAVERGVSDDIGGPASVDGAADAVDGQHGDDDDEAGEQAEPPLAGEEGASFGDQQAPLGRRRGRAQAEEAEG